MLPRADRDSLPSELQADAAAKEVQQNADAGPVLHMLEGRIADWRSCKAGTATRQPAKQQCRSFIVLLPRIRD